MARLTIDIPDSLMAFAQALVEEGAEESLEQLVIRLLIRHRSLCRHPEISAAHLKAELELGLAQLDRGEGIDVEEAFRRLRSGSGLVRAS